jgi:hypothetical protein
VRDVVDVPLTSQCVVLRLVCGLGHCDDHVAALVTGFDVPMGLGDVGQLDGAVNDRQKCTVAGQVRKSDQVLTTELRGAVVD